MVEFPERSRAGHLLFTQEYVLTRRETAVATRKRLDGKGQPVEEDDDDEEKEAEMVETVGATIVKVPLAGLKRSLRLEQFPNGLCDPRATLALLDTLISSFRSPCSLGTRVIELGCGLGLPGLVCALLGANVTVSDLPDSLATVKRNAAQSGFPQDIWKVVAGKVAGGIVVQKAVGFGAEKEPEKLGFGALVEQIGQEGDLIHFRRLVGTGPDSGWVRTRQPWGQTLLVESDETPPSERDQGSVTAVALQWGDRAAAQALLKHGEFSLVLCSDCVNEPLYGRKALQGLVETIDILCKPGTIAIVSVQRRIGDGVSVFMEDMTARFFVDEYSSRNVGGSEICVYIVRRRTPPEEFHEGLNFNFNSGSGPPGTPLKVVRDLKSNRAKPKKAPR